MTYEEFKKELYHNLQRQETEGCQVLLLEKGRIFVDAETAEVIRLVNLGNHGREDMTVRADTICVVQKKHGILSLLQWNVRSLHERFKKEGWQSVLPEIVMKIQRAEETRERLSMAGQGMSAGQMILRPLNYQVNREELENGIYWRFGDIALVLYLLVYEGGEDFVTMKVRHDMTEKWDTTDEILLTNALLNSYAKMPPRLYYGTDIRPEYDRSYGVFMPGEKGEGIVLHPEEGQEGLHGYRLTTTGWLNGALALFYPGVKERLAELLNGDYYVGFISIHEAVIHPVSSKALGEMKAAIQHINVMFEEREMLTSRVYRYSCARKELIEV